MRKARDELRRQMRERMMASQSANGVPRQSTQTPTRELGEDRSAETALQESQQITAALLDAVPARIFWKDKNLVYLGCNAPFAHDAGFSRPEDIIGKDDYQMGWREQAELYRAADRDVVETGKSKLLIDEPQTTPEGKIITLLTSKVPLRDSKGEVFGVLGTYMDVTERARLEEQLSFSNLLNKTAIDNAPDAILVVDENARIISFNSQFIELWNLPRDLVESGAYEPVLQMMTAQFTDGQAFMTRVQYLYAQTDEKAQDELRLKNGRVIDRHTAPLRDVGQKYLGRIWYYRDITERERTNDQLRMANQKIEKQNLQFEAALNNMAQGLLMFDRDGKLIISNRRFAELFKIPWEKWQAASSGMTIQESMQLIQKWTNVTEKNQAQLSAEIRSLLERRKGGQIVFERSDGRTFSSMNAPMANGGFVVTLEDITEQRRTEEKISHMAHHDALTDLPNRILFYEKLDELLSRAPQSAPFAVFSLDLDRFKGVNDSLGHPIGDKLLQAVAERMRGCIRDTDIAARLGGDEFAIVQVDIQTAVRCNLARDTSDRHCERALSA